MMQLMRHRQNTNVTLNFFRYIGNLIGTLYFITILKLKIENNVCVKYTLPLRSK